ncbi:LacI family DNA-binding transcriptional regulator [Dactylosporangium aurantiacum]|uniref:LacI family DNA-binding transcriptional regulator n=1 Tax=Dactylosporangium aurantiacum TaxID=35754 RepID=A0A9Q9ISU1_9ACTN|nr:LacI family DNA-binding transcriptional regulator [Dactylosporangium aurantiacum]MDG6107650.1 LacI family DNA-binding transcriptional regulator [Dactylosporangium aurantiacum]UWZ58755.1 LacI family DNA-binding transcriptional regulator [Dactylosporangium aurantiacum]
MAVTLHDVAREAGVSYATASRALNGSDRNVRQENAVRVQAAAARLGYVPHAPAQAIARGSTNTVALVVSDVDDPYFSMIAAGVIDAAEDAGLIVTMAVADRSPGLELQIVRTLRGHRPRAIVVAGSRIDGSGERASLVEELEAYRASGGRVSLISQPDLPFPTFAIDNTGGARRLALELAGLGYQRFAVVHGDDAIRASRDRRTAFADGLREAGLGLDPGCEIATDFSRSGGLAAAERLAELARAGVEAVFAVTDVMAIGAMSGLRAAGLRPGVDLALAGFDDIEAAGEVTPGLTSVRAPLREVGRRAVEAALSGAPAGVVDIPVEVVLRDSTPPRHRGADPPRTVVVNGATHLTARKGHDVAASSQAHGHVT